jgi:hypothetical protein
VGGLLFGQPACLTRERLQHWQGAWVRGADPGPRAARGGPGGSTPQHAAIDDFVAKELAASRMVAVRVEDDVEASRGEGPSAHPVHEAPGEWRARREHVWVAPFVVAPKQEADGTVGFRVCHDLTRPAASGVRGPVALAALPPHVRGYNADVDLTPLQPAMLASPADVLQRVRFLRSQRPDATVHLFKVDVRSHFRNFPLSRAGAARHTQSWRGQLYAHTVSSFGNAANVHLLGGYTNGVMDWAAAHGRCLFVVVDDIVAVNYADAIEGDIAFVDEAMRVLGLPPHPLKREGPSTALTVFGVRVDTVSGVATPSDRRRRALLDLCDDMEDRHARGQSVSVGTLLRFAGACCSMMDLFPWARTHVSPVWRACYFPNGDSHAVAVPDVSHQRRVSEPILWCARWWRRALAGSLGLTPFDAGVRGPRLHVIRIRCDAAREAGLGFGAVVVSSGAGDAEHFYVHERWPEGVSVVHNNVLELACIVAVVGAAAPMAGGKLVVVESDNTTAVVSSRREGSTSDLAMCFSALLSALQEAYRFFARVHYLQGSRQTTADALSRLLPAADPASVLPTAAPPSSLGSPARRVWAHLPVPRCLTVFGTEPLTCLLLPPSRGPGGWLRPPRHFVTWVDSCVNELLGVNPPTWHTSAPWGPVTFTPPVPFLPTHPAFLPSLREPGGASAL